MKTFSHKIPLNDTKIVIFIFQQNGKLQISYVKCRFSLVVNCGNNFSIHMKCGNSKALSTGFNGFKTEKNLEKQNRVGEKIKMLGALAPSILVKTNCRRPA